MTLTSRLSASECVPTDAAALLIGRAKDNHASCAVGPFVRVMDPRFTHKTGDVLRIAASERGALVNGS